jgi:Haemolysin-type calcium binding protein related domain.
VYLFGIGSGNDTVYEDDYYDTDTVRFGSGIKSSEIEIRRDGNDLVLAISGSEDSIRIKDYFISRYHVVEVFEFSDGTVAEMDTGTMSFNIKVYGTDFDEEADEPVVDTNEESSLEIVVTNNEKSEQKEAA